jgi:hypothetical protein
VKKEGSTMKDEPMKWKKRNTNTSKKAVKRASEL